MVIAFLIGALVYGGAAFALGAPLFVVARRRGRDKVFRGFAWGGAAVALSCALLAAGTHGLRASCAGAGHNLSYACLDIGAAGLQLLGVGGFTVVSWITAFVITRD